jgi:DNA-binding NarL/FixJ family response regulator
MTEPRSGPVHRVVVADDHPVFRAGLRAILDAAPDLEVVAEAADGVEAVDLTVRHAPDLLLLDLQMPELGGLDVIPQVLAQRPETRILVLTMQDQRESLTAALRLGARGYLLKGSGHAEVLGAVRGVLAGVAVLSSGVADHLPGLVAGAPTRRAFPGLTDREEEILGLMALGRTNSEIAAELTLSLKTVRNYVSSIFAKIGVAGRAQAVVKARDAGLADVR